MSIDSKQQRSEVYQVKENRFEGEDSIWQLLEFDYKRMSFDGEQNVFYTLESKNE